MNLYCGITEEIRKDMLQATSNSIILIIFILSHWIITKTNPVVDFLTP